MERFAARLPLLVALLVALSCVAPPASGEDLSTLAPYDDDLDDEAVDLAVIGGRRETGLRAMGYVTSKHGAFDPSFGYAFCGATLIHPRVAVTAAHCVTEPMAPYFLGFGDVPPVPQRVAAWRRRDLPNEYEVSRVVVNESYRYVDDDPNDIALLILSRAVTDVTPAVVGHAPPSFDCGREHGRSLRAVGYGGESPGLNDFDFDPPQHRKSQLLCALRRAHNDREIELRSLDGGTCKGDSGGGLFVEGASVNGRDVLVGVASHLTSNRCATGSEVHFMYLPGHAKWIAERARAALGTAFCPEGDLCDLTFSWAREDVRYLVARGIVSGLGDGTFGPDQRLTRAQFAVLLSHSFSDLPVVRRDVPSFSDRAQIPSWAWPHVVASYQRGLLSGHANGTFGPSDPLTRLQAMVAIASGLRWTGTDADLSRFVDQGQVPAWGRTQTAGAARRGVPTGYHATLLRPNDPATRAEAAAFLARALRSR